MSALVRALVELNAAATLSLHRPAREHASTTVNGGVRIHPAVREFAAAVVIA